MKCRHCDIEFRRPVEVPIPHDRCTRCHEEIEALAEAEKRREAKLAEDEKIVVVDEDDCDGCKI